MKKFGLLFFLIGLLVLSACDNDQEDKATSVPPSPAAGLNVGDAAPDFTLTAATGEDVSLQDYVGTKPVLLYFHMAVG